MASDPGELAAVPKKKSAQTMMDGAEQEGVVMVIGIMRITEGIILEVMEDLVVV